MCVKHKKLFYLGVSFAVFSAFFYASQTAIIKLTMVSMPVPLLMFLQSVISLLLIIPILIKKEGANSINLLSSSKIKSEHLLRTVFSLGISFFLFTALKHMSYFNSLLLYNAFPLFIPLIGLIILGVKLNHKFWPFLFVGFLGVVFTLNVDKNIFSLYSFYALLSGLSAALSIVMIKKISKKDGSLISLYYYFTYSTIICLMFSIPYFRDLAHLNWLVIVVIGALFFLLQYFLVLATVYTTPTIVSSLYYLNIVFSLIFSHYIFNEMMTKVILVGMLCIVVGSAGVIFCQRSTSFRTEHVKRIN